MLSSPRPARRVAAVPAVVPRGRTRRVAAVPAVVLAAILALAGCQTDPAAAAVVGGQAITLDSLNHTVDLALANANFASRIGGRAAAQRAELARLVAQRVIDLLASREGVSASLVQVQQEQAAISAEVQSQQGVSLPVYYAAIGVPPSQVTSIVRSITLERLIGERLARVGNATSAAAGTAAQNAFRGALLAESRRLDVAINPRFGVWSAAQLEVLAAPDVLSVPAK
jgi:hypothetical protein